MIRTQFHARSDAGRRGENLPVRLRFASRRGVTLVELLISMLIFTIVCISWLKIIGLQSVRKEARRREAVERLSGMMDAFLFDKRKSSSVGTGSYELEMNTSINTLSFKKDENTNVVHQVFDGDASPIGYQLHVVSNPPFQSDFVGWSGKWLVGRLYDRSGAIGDVGRPFFTLPVCLGL